MSFRICSFFFTFVCIAGCVSEPYRARDHLARMSTPKSGEGVYGCSDTIAVAGASGVDYQHVVDRAMRRDEKALRSLFWLTSHAGFDAASSEGHAAVLGNILRSIGDGSFGVVLSTESESTREAVLDGLRYDFGVESGALTDELLSAWYPRTFTSRAADNQPLRLTGDVRR